jgi:hypothetical protein
MYWNPPLSGFRRLYMKVLNRLLFSTSDVVIANSTEMIQKAKTDGAHTVEMIGTPIAKSFLCRPIRPIARAFTTTCVGLDPRCDGVQSGQNHFHPNLLGVICSPSDDAPGSARHGLATFTDRMVERVAAKRDRIRIFIHPNDLELHLAGDLATFLNQCSRSQTYRSIR